MIEFSLAEMVLISPNITAIARNVTSVDRKTVNWTWFPLKMQGVFIVMISEVRVFILLFVLPQKFWLKVWPVHYIAFPHEMGLSLSTLRPWRQTSRKVRCCKMPHSFTLIVFLCENELFQRGWGVFVTLVEIPKGWGVISSLQKWKIQGGGGVLSEIPSVVGVWIFSGTTQCT